MKRIPIGLVLILLVACQPENDRQVTINIELEEPVASGNAVIRFEGTLPDSQNEGSIEFKDTSNGSIDIELSEPALLRVTGEVDAYLYAVPGDEISISVTNEGDPTITNIGGDGSGYQDTINAFYQNSKIRGSSPSYNFESSDWTTHQEEVARFVADNTQLIRDGDLPEQARKLLEADLFTKEAMVIDGYRYKAENAPEKYTAVPDDIITFQEACEKAINDYSYAFAAGHYSYFIHRCLRERYSDMLAETRDDRSDTQQVKNDRDDNLNFNLWILNAEPVNETVQEYVVGSGLAYLASRIDFGKATAIKDRFIEKFPQSAFNEQIQKEFAKWDALQEGKTAPDFAYKNIDGEMVSLSSLRGNVVYIDVWATWCPPCIKEFPDYRKLKARIGDVEDLVWLYVSIDKAEDRQKWLDAIEKHELEGTHLFIGGNQYDNWRSEIADKYNISMIPRYIIIDKEGNIASANAPRPSTGDVIYDMIQDLRSRDYESLTSLN